MIAIDAASVYDRQEIATKKTTRSFGIFLEELLQGFIENGLQDKFCLVVYDDDQEFFKEKFPEFKLLPLKWWGVDVLRFFSGKKRHYKQFYKRGIYGKIVDDNCSCIWFPFTLHCDNVIDCNIPKVLTIHDLITYYGEGLSFQHKFKNMVNKTQKFVTISEYVKQDCINELKLPASSISVSPNSILLDIDEESKPEGVPAKYILDMNGYGEHKNHITTLKAYKKIADKCDLDLVFCGGWKQEDYYEQLCDAIDEFGLKDRVKLYYKVSNEERTYLIKHTTLFVTSSKQEGFGRGPVEASICEVPVISSKCTSLHEVTLGLVNYYENVEDAEELAEVMLKVINNPPSREELKSIAEKLKQTYTPKACALKYWEILRKYEEEN